MVHTIGIIMENTTHNDTTKQGPAHDTTDQNAEEDSIPENNNYYTILLVSLGLVIYIASYIIRRRNKKKKIKKQEEQYLNYYHSILPQSQIYRGSSNSNLTSMVESFQNKRTDELRIKENLGNIAGLILMNPLPNEINRTPKQSSWDQTRLTVNQDHVIRLEQNIEGITKSHVSKKQNPITTNWRDDKRKFNNRSPERPSNSTCEHVQATNYCENCDDNIKGIESDHIFLEIDKTTHSCDDFDGKHEGIELKQLSSLLTREDGYKTNQRTYFNGSINDTEFVQKSNPTDIFDSDYEQIETSIPSNNNENSIYTNQDPRNFMSKHRKNISDHIEYYTSESCTHIAPEVMIMERSCISDDISPDVDNTYNNNTTIYTNGSKSDILISSEMTRTLSNNYGSITECPMNTQIEGNDHCVVTDKTMDVKRHHANRGHFECKVIIPEDYVTGFWI